MEDFLKFLDNKDNLQIDIKNRDFLIETFRSQSNHIEIKQFNNSVKDISTEFYCPEAGCNFYSSIESVIDNGSVTCPYCNFDILTDKGKLDDFIITKDIYMHRKKHEKNKQKAKDKENEDEIEDEIEEMDEILKDMKRRNKHVEIVKYGGSRDVVSEMYCTKAKGKFYASIDTVVGDLEDPPLCPYCRRESIIQMGKLNDLRISTNADFSDKKYNTGEGITPESPNFEWTIDDYVGNNEIIKEYIGYKFNFPLEIGLSLLNNSNIYKEAVRIEMNTLTKVENFTKYRYKGRVYNLKNIQDRKDIEEEMERDGRNDLPNFLREKEKEAKQDQKKKKADEKRVKKKKAKEERQKKKVKEREEKKKRGRVTSRTR